MQAIGAADRRFDLPELLEPVDIALRPVFDQFGRLLQGIAFFEIVAARVVGALQGRNLLVESCHAQVDAAEDRDHRHHRAGPRQRLPQAAAIGFDDFLPRMQKIDRGHPRARACASNRPKGGKAPCACGPFASKSARTPGVANGVSSTWKSKPKALPERFRQPRQFRRRTEDPARRDAGAGGRLREGHRRVRRFREDLGDDRFGRQVRRRPWPRA